MKVLCLVLVVMFVMGIASVALANNLHEWVRGNDVDEPLITSLYIAKTIEIGKEEDGKAIRVKFERTNNIGDFNRALYQISAGLEF